ncbi:MAG: sortase [Oscillospiraceae bacterium]|jgi:sortase A|nr:sortase [Oscillospiraceae bacterium]
MKTKIGVALMVFGAGLLLFSAGLLTYNLYDEKRAAERSAEVLDALNDQLPDERQSADSQLEDLLGGSDMRTVEIDGQQYIGVLEIPSQGLSFPVLSEWSYPKLKIAPCRYKGSVFDDSLILAAHNYKKHFGGISLLKTGDLVAFTDVDGNVFTYRVSLAETLAGTAVQAMESGEWDLTLFTCTYNGKSRVTIRCERIPGGAR